MKWMGALMVIIACGGWGFMTAANDRAAGHELELLERTLEWIGKELSCRMWPLPALFRQVAQLTEGTLKKVLMDFSDELDRNAVPDACACMELVLLRYPGYSSQCRQILSELGKTLGRYELKEQLQEVVVIHDQVQRLVQEHRAGQKERLRCYQTVGVCGGMGLAILLL